MILTRLVYLPQMVLLGWLLLSCESPFTPPSDDQDVFEVSHDFESGPRLIKKVPITLTWSRMTFSSFEKYTILRSVSNGEDVEWIQRAEITDPLQQTYTDTIDDDLTFRYKVRIEFSTGEFQEAEAEPISIRTTSIIVPDECECLQDAYDTQFIDSGDTIYVNPLTPCTITGTLNLLNKDVYIKSLMGKEETIVDRSGTILFMNRGTLSGFTFKRGRIELSGTAVLDECIVSEVYDLGNNGAVSVRDSAEVRNCLIVGNNNFWFTGEGGNGGGIIVQDYAVIRNCRITGNKASERGGGIFIGGEPIIMNCIINNNYARQGGGGVFVEFSAKPTIVNSVIYNNKSGLPYGESGAVLLNKAKLNLLNSIVWGNSSYGSEDRLWRNSSYSNIQSYSGGTGNRSSLPLFVDPVSGDFHLQPDSPCIDAGHPGDEYRDVDGSRNDMGAYGGPFGE